MMNVTLVKLINRMKCQRKLLFFFFSARERYLKEMQNEVEDNKSTKHKFKKELVSTLCILEFSHLENT